MSSIFDAEITCRYGLVALGLAPAAFLASLVRKPEGNVEMAEFGAKVEITGAESRIAI